jgi:hypothetical protein
MDVTRRQVLGLGVVALGALKLPAAAQAKVAGPTLFELPLPYRPTGATWRTTPTIQAPQRFDLVGLTWSEGHAQAQVRARVHGRRWSRWTALPHPHGPHVRGTDPAFTGAADELQFRIRGNATRLRARFVRALPHAPAKPRAHAAQAGVPQMVFRDGWGASHVPPRGEPSYGSVQMAFVHHTAGTIEYAPEDSAGIVLGIARYHRDSNRWNDIGYNFLVDRYGTIFEGRAGGIDQAVVGAQAQGFNSYSTGIATLGTFTNIPLDEPAMESLARLIGWKLSLHAAPTQGQLTLISGGGASNRYRSGTPVTFERISGHRDADQTTCPGDALYAQLPDLRNRASRYATPVSAITVKAASQRGAKPTSVSGAIRFADGSSPAGAPLAVEYAGKGTTAFSQIGTTQVGLDGSWATSVVLPASGKVRAVFAGDATRPRLESRPVNVKVVPSLAITTSRRRAKHGRTFRVTGTLNPTQALVVCLLEKQSRGRWVTVQRKRIAPRQSRIDTKVRPKTPGLYRVSIIADGVTRRRTIRALH